jgi:cytoskeleton protein RodZ
VASFGESLREARKARNITLQEIADITKIGTRTLQALENEQFDLLPGGIFNKGFVRSYARCVGLDEERTVAAYMAAAKVVPSEADVRAISTQLYGARVTQNEPWWVNAKTIVGILAVIVALGMGALWLKEQRKEARELAASQQRVESPGVSAGAPVSITPPAATPNAQSATASEATNNATAALNTTQSTPQGTIQTGNQANGTANPAGGVAPQPTASVPAPSKGSSAPVEISISATARAWISVRSDGKAIETLTLDPGKPELSSRSYKAQEKLMLTVGNPAGVSVTYNGKPTGTLGVEGHRTVITFTPQGMVKE